MKSFNRKRYALSVAIAAALLPLGVQAQSNDAAAQDTPAQQPTKGQSATTLDTIVVTGAAAGGVKKLEASYNIVTANEAQIKQANPKSTADLLKISPGLWPESSGGQTGANIEIAGFPGGGDAPYFSTLLMGSPLYGMPSMSFFETTSLFRLDDTVQSVEILQGGPSVVFADGQIGATANFFLKTGTDTPSGSVGLTYGDEGLWRLDGFTGFKVADGWYGSIGGFYRSSDGVRDPQFKADEGGQLTATLSHDMDKGNLTLYGRYVNDKNQFITPIPLIQTGKDNFREYPGFDPLTDTYYSKAIQKVSLPGYPGGGTNADLANGRGTKFLFFGGNFDYAFDNGWSISDKFLFSGGDVDTNALFSGNNPATLNDELFADIGGGNLLPDSTTSYSANYVNGEAVDPNQSVIHQGWWYIHKRLKSFNNDFRLSKELFDGNTLTAGFYINHYTMDDKWALGNQMLMSNEPNARPITVSYVDGGVTKQRTDSQGFLDYGDYNIAQNGSATNMALYLSDSWRIGKWLFDLSGRIENQDATSNVCNFQSDGRVDGDGNPITGRIDLDNNPNTIYNNSVPVCDGTFARNEYDKSHPAFTAGATYSFTDHTAVYGRVNSGGHFLDFDNGIRGTTNGNFPPMQTIRNYEVGYKFQSSLLYADISAYRRVFDGLLYQPTNGAGTPIGSPTTYGSDSVGVNFIGALTPVENLRLQLVANYLDGEYTAPNSFLQYTDINGQPAFAPIDGKQLQRQPKLRYMFTPSYKFVYGWGDIMPYVTYTHVGPHTQDQSALQQLGSYNTWDFGVTSNVGDHWQFAVRGTNMTNELGLTESNSRIFGSALTSDGVLLARPIEGREVNVQAKYTW